MHSSLRLLDYHQLLALSDTDCGDLFRMYYMRDGWVLLHLCFAKEKSWKILTSPFCLSSTRPSLLHGSQGPDDRDVSQTKFFMQSNSVQYVMYHV